MRLIIHKQTPTRVPARALARLFREIVNYEASPHWQAEVHLIFTTDRRIRNLNREYRGKDRPTDVLSFNIDPPEEPSSILGEVYISVQTATRQARSVGHPLQDEYLRLACHGCMHLLGYDHVDEHEARDMEIREKKYLARVKER